MVALQVPSGWGLERPHTTGKNVFINPKNRGCSRIRACSLIRLNTVIIMLIGVDFHLSLKTHKCYFEC